MHSSAAELSREERTSVVRHLKRLPVRLSGTLGYDKAEVTAGGVALEEVDPRTLESRLQPGLYFVGEILDVDGRLGGYNFQWAWSTGWVAGRSAMR
jgi:predicted flavoprotein YhiN